MKIFRTNFDYFVTSISTLFSQNFLGPWSLRSIGILSLLLGFYMASTLTSYFLVVLEHRILTVFLMLIFLELSVRLRNSLLLKKKYLTTRALDNLRLGITYAVVLEAFKLGS